MLESWDSAVTDNPLVVLATIITIALAIVFIGLVASGRGKGRTLSSRRAVPPPEAPQVAALAGHGSGADGLETYRWALAVREDALGPDHPDVATACHILGAAYSDRARFSEAEPLLRRALAIRTHVFGPEHGEVADTIEDLSSLYKAQGRDVEAQSLLESLPATRQAVRSVPLASSPDAMPLIAHNGDVTATDGDHAAASAGLRDLSEAQPDAPKIPAPTPDSRVPADQDRGERTPMPDESAGSRGADGEAASAQALHRRALAMMESTGATESPELRTVLRELGRFYYRRGAYAEAEPLLERALALAQGALGVDAREVAEIREDLAWLRFSRRSLPGR